MNVSENEKTTILVTGAAGFIGYHFCKKLINLGFNVVGVDNINNYYDVDLKVQRLRLLEVEVDSANLKTEYSSKYINFKFYRENIENDSWLRELFESHKPEFVCHLAAQAGVRYSLERPDKYIQSNIVAFSNIIELAKTYKVKHFVYASSSSVYGLSDNSPLSIHEPAVHPVSLYAATKRSNELIAHSYSHIFDLPTTGIRFFTVYGPWGRPDMSPMLFANAIIEKRPIKVFNYGEMERDFTYIDDIVEGIWLIMNFPPSRNKAWDRNELDPSSSEAPFAIFNLGNSQPIKLIDYIEAMEEAIGVKAIKEFHPLQAGDVLKTFADMTDFIKQFNFQPQTSIKEGLERFVSWYKSYYNN